MQPNESRLRCGRKVRGRPCARSFYGTGPAHKRTSSLLGRADIGMRKLGCRIPANAKCNPAVTQLSSGRRKGAMWAA